MALWAVSGHAAVAAEPRAQIRGDIDAELRRVCGGPAVSHATVAQLQARIDVLRARVRS